MCPRAAGFSVVWNMTHLWAKYTNVCIYKDIHTAQDHFAKWSWVALLWKRATLLWKRATSRCICARVLHFAKWSWAVCWEVEAHTPFCNAKGEGGGRVNSVGRRWFLVYILQFRSMWLHTIFSELGLFGGEGEHMFMSHVTRINHSCPTEFPAAQCGGRWHK